MEHLLLNAFRAIEQKPFDAYVMDDKLPDGSGLDIAEWIRSKGSEAPIILISGYDASSVASRAGKFGIFAYLQKPFSREIICNAMKKAIASTKAHRPDSNPIDADLLIIERSSGENDNTLMISAAQA